MFLAQQELAPAQPQLAYREGGFLRAVLGTGRQLSLFYLRQASQNSGCLQLASWYITLVQMFFSVLYNFCDELRRSQPCWAKRDKEGKKPSIIASFQLLALSQERGFSTTTTHTIPFNFLHSVPQRAQSQGQEYVNIWFQYTHLLDHAHGLNYPAHF